MYTRDTQRCCDDGLIFTGCSMTNTAAAQPAGGRRRQVLVGGKRVKTIDVHAHCVVAEALALLGQTVEEQRGPGIGDVAGPARQELIGLTHQVRRQFRLAQLLRQAGDLQIVVHQPVEPFEHLGCDGALLFVQALFQVLAFGERLGQLPVRGRAL